MDDDVIDISNMTSEQFVEHMRVLDKQSKCPCHECNGCDEQMHKQDCDEYQEWVRRYVLG